MNCSKCKKATKPDWVAYSDSQTMLCYDCVDEFEATILHNSIKIPFSFF